MVLNRAAFVLLTLTLWQLQGCTRKNIRPDRPIQIDRGPPKLVGSPVDIFITGYDGAEGLPVATVEVIKYDTKPSSFDDSVDSYSLGRSGQKKISDLKSGETYFFAAKVFDSAGNIIALTQFGDLKCDVVQVVAANQVSIRIPVCKYVNEVMPDYNPGSGSGNSNINIKIETPK